MLATTATTKLKLETSVLEPQQPRLDDKNLALMLSGFSTTEPGTSIGGNGGGRAGDRIWLWLLQKTEIELQHNTKQHQLAWIGAAWTNSRLL